jgi:hypothetical protein
MKKSAENRYPHSAELFRFCKEALSIKHNFEVKVIDQHVGAILGYDPADCSHWKKGKKNIKSLQTVNAIATHLEVDARFVTDIISGKSDLEESLQEYRGYGPLAVSSRYHDEVKREYFRNPGKYSTGGEQRTFEQVVDLQRAESVRMTRGLIERADVRSCPVLLPELEHVLLPHVRMVEVDGSQMPAGKPVDASFEGNATLVRYRRGEMKPHLRTLIAREIGRTLLSTVAPQAEGGEADELAQARMNLFAGLLLVPGDLLQRAMRQVNHGRDIVGQLSEIFWVGRSVMNARLKDFLEHGN